MSKKTPTRATWKSHGRPAGAVMYHGIEDEPDGGRLVVVEVRGGLLYLSEADTGEHIRRFGSSTRMWLAPA